jgi:hypothetical protein
VLQIRIQDPDPGELFFVNYDELLLKPKGARKKEVFIFDPAFYVRSGIKKKFSDPGWKNECSDPDNG